jgi:hypothetical protein
MRDPADDESSPMRARHNDWAVAGAIALSIFICIAAFIWIFVELEPFMSDFTGSDVIVTPDSNGPSASPVDGTVTSNASDSP